MEHITAQDYIKRLQTAMERNSRGPREIEACCEYAGRLLDARLPVLFDAAHVQSVLRLKEIDWNQAYHVFPISQGVKTRTVTAPSLPLKTRQRWILTEILPRFEVSPRAHGFEPGRSIKTNAELHAGHEYALCLDIHDFFPSIRKESVIRVFLEAGYSRGASSALAEVCCFKKALPQGAPTSPRLSNIIFKELDERLEAMARRRGITYSRYADDLTFSSHGGMGNILREVECLLRPQGFLLNEEKVHFYGPGAPKRITGLVVQNGSVRVPKEYKRRLKQEIYYCKKYGVLTHLENTGAKKFVHYREYLYGKAYYIHMIEPEAGNIYLEELDQIRWPGFFAGEC